MPKVINLRTRRKQAEREAARKTGDEQAANHGTSKALRDLTRALAEKAERDLDGHRLSARTPPRDA